MYYRTEEDLYNITNNLIEVLKGRHDFENRINFMLESQDVVRQTSVWEASFKTDNGTNNEVFVIDDLYLTEYTTYNFLRYFGGDVKAFLENTPEEIGKEGIDSLEYEFLTTTIKSLKNLFGEDYYNKFIFLYVTNDNIGINPF